ncbi:hypothetical protein ACFFGR_10950 [Arthrobacter liuii]|uniref:Uncharacterized protein n=1 Tax=Arthrobacter liuii TaxID=1476996 RepID=A0ABQ2AZC0_9MICC|nr:hypothetical protein [Arthrobacter liuii]GGI03153.1 hypothetical protein GCM10007170_46480 [Arthrobacter liuii]
MNHEPGTTTIQVADAESIDRELDTAVAAVREQALQERRRGILVTRRGPDSFTVALSDEVPFGLTREKHDW